MKSFSRYSTEPEARLFPQMILHDPDLFESRLLNSHLGLLARPEAELLQSILLRPQSAFSPPLDLEPNSITTERDKYCIWLLICFKLTSLSDQERDTALLKLAEQLNINTESLTFLSCLSGRLSLVRHIQQILPAHTWLRAIQRENYIALRYIAGCGYTDLFDFTLNHLSQFQSHDVVVVLPREVLEDDPYDILDTALVNNQTAIVRLFFERSRALGCSFLDLFCFKKFNLALMLVNHNHLDLLTDLITHLQSTPAGQQALRQLLTQSGVPHFALESKSWDCFYRLIELAQNLGCLSQLLRKDRYLICVDILISHSCPQLKANLLTWLGLANISIAYVVQAAYATDPLIVADSLRKENYASLLENLSYLESLRLSYKVLYLPNKTLLDSYLVFEAVAIAGHIELLTEIATQAASQHLTVAEKLDDITEEDADGELSHAIVELQKFYVLERLLIVAQNLRQDLEPLFFKVLSYAVTPPAAELANIDIILTLAERYDINIPELLAYEDYRLFALAFSEEAVFEKLIAVAAKYEITRAQVLGSVKLLIVTELKPSKKPAKATDPELTQKLTDQLAKIAEQNKPLIKDILANSDYEIFKYPFKTNEINVALWNRLYELLPTESQADLLQTQWGLFLLMAVRHSNPNPTFTAQLIAWANQTQVLATIFPYVFKKIVRSRPELLPDFMNLVSPYAPPLRQTLEANDYAIFKAPRTKLPGLVKLFQIVFRYLPALDLNAILPQLLASHYDNLRGHLFKPITDNTDPELSPSNSLATLKAESVALTQLIEWTAQNILNPRQMFDARYTLLSLSAAYGNLETFNTIVTLLLENFGLPIMMLISSDYFAPVRAAKTFGNLAIVNRLVELSLLAMPGLTQLMLINAYGLNMKRYHQNLSLALVSRLSDLHNHYALISIPFYTEQWAIFEFALHHANLAPLAQYLLNEIFVLRHATDTPNDELKHKAIKIFTHNFLAHYRAQLIGQGGPALNFNIPNSYRWVITAFEVLRYLLKTQTENPRTLESVHLLTMNPGLRSYCFMPTAIVFNAPFRLIAHDLLDLTTTKPAFADIIQNLILAAPPPPPMPAVQGILAGTTTGPGHAFVFHAQPPAGAAPGLISTATPHHLNTSDVGAAAMDPER